MDTIDRDNISTQPAAPERDKSKVLRAKPTKDKVIDHGALTDNIIARFPNILKALAE